MTLEAASSSRSLRRQADRLELKLARRQRNLRLRIDSIKQGFLAGLTSPAMLFGAFGAGVALERSGHRIRDSLAFLLNSGYAGARLLSSLSSAIVAREGSQQDPNLDHVHPI